jgi:hypothetical protein
MMVVMAQHVIQQVVAVVVLVVLVVMRSMQVHMVDRW